MKAMKVGVVGCGQISAIYLQNCTQTFGQSKPVLEVLACADLVPELARRRADEFHIPQACSVEELLAHPEIEIVLNLTSPQAHAELNRAALRAGKHVYTEKPFALNQKDAEEVLALARGTGLRVGCAPDTFLGGGLQTCRQLIDDGAIGTPYAASGLILMGNVYDGLHPRFEDYLKLGWDPLFDMAPYYLTAFVFLLGPVRRVSGSTGQVHREITITNPQSPRYGETVPVPAPMHAAATLDFASGAIATLQAAKESFGYTPRLEIYGTDGILHAPDPNTFGGPIRVQHRDGSITDVPLSHGFRENSRGIGIADMALAIRTGRPHRASGDLARHVLEITLGIFESSRTERHVPITIECERPAALPTGLLDNQLDM
jgi:predicted dehydrogenase